jgi:hypothetical protein
MLGFWFGIAVGDGVVGCWSWKLDVQKRKGWEWEWEQEIRL